MKTITFTCETITPMFLSGADGQTPELRPPSIKGALRFWWRAMNGHLELKLLKEREAMIFGGTDEKIGRSKVLIRSKNSPQNLGKAYMLPHKETETRKSNKPAFLPNSTFTLEIGLVKEHIYYEKKEIMNIGKLIHLFTLVCCLGGFGKRSRRGFGSVRIKEVEIDKAKSKDFKMPENLVDIYQLFDSEHFKLGENKITTRFTKPYPCIKSIEFGKELRDLTYSIINSSHQVKYSTGLGRHASPIYVSTLDNIHPIITTLSFQGNQSLQKTFKDKLING